MKHMMKLEELWAEIMENDSVVIELQDKAVREVKRKISRYKHRKSNELEEDLGRLKFEELDREGHKITLRIWLEEYDGPDIPVNLLRADNEQAQEEWEDMHE